MLLFTIKIEFSVPMRCPKTLHKPLKRGLYQTKDTSSYKNIPFIQVLLVLFSKEKNNNFCFKSIFVKYRLTAE